MMYRLSSGGSLAFVSSLHAGQRGVKFLPWGYALSARQEAPRTARKIGGYATRFNKVHAYDGGFDILEPGVFARSLAGGSTVRFLEGHDEGSVVGFTGGGGLYLKADDVGLAFTLDVPDTAAGVKVWDDVQSGRKTGMSVKYRCEHSEKRTIAGQSVRFIIEARLMEVSLVRAGAVAEAYAEVVDANGDEPRRQTAAAADHSAACARFSSALRAVYEHYA